MPVTTSDGKPNDTRAGAKPGTRGIEGANTTVIGTNAVDFRMGDTITVTGFPSVEGWLVNGSYRIDKIGIAVMMAMPVPNMSAEDLKSFVSTRWTGRNSLVVTSLGNHKFGPTDASFYGTGSVIDAAGMFIEDSGIRITSSGGAIFAPSSTTPGVVFFTNGAPMGGGLFITMHSLLPDPTVSTQGEPVKVDPPTVPTAPRPVIDVRIKPINQPVVKTTPKPGISTATTKGKVSFINKVRAASKVSKLNKAQADQAMVDVAKAIKDAELKKKNPLRKPTGRQ